MRAPQRVHRVRACVPLACIDEPCDDAPNVACAHAKRTQLALERLGVDGLRLERLGAGVAASRHVASRLHVLADRRLHLLPERGRHFDLERLLPRARQVLVRLRRVLGLLGACLALLFSRLALRVALLHRLERIRGPLPRVARRRLRLDPLELLPVLARARWQRLAEAQVVKQAEQGVRRAPVLGLEARAAVEPRAWLLRLEPHRVRVGPLLLVLLAQRHHARVPVLVLPRLHLGLFPAGHFLQPLVEHIERRLDTLGEELLRAVGARRGLRGRLGRIALDPVGQRRRLGRRCAARLDRRVLFSWRHARRGPGSGGASNRAQGTSTCVAVDRK